MKVPPSRLDVYKALCELSPKGYAVLAQMIVSTANAERHRNIERARRRARTRGRPKKDPESGSFSPVITIDRDDREGA